MSIAGGYHKAIERGVVCGCRCVQLFTKNSNRWYAKEITPAESQTFRTALAESGLCDAIAHDSYLINLATPDKTLWKKSIDAFVVELHRAEILGISYVVTHPGCYMGSSESAGLRRVAKALDRVHAQTRGLAVRCLLETTAGQGTSLGHRFEHLAAIIDRANAPDRLGVCFDTCHVFAAGYALAGKRAYWATMKEFDQIVGLGRIKAFHLNDSVRDRGSRIDRHAHIGRGRMGLEPFRLLLNDRRLADVPMYLETPKGEEDGADFDRVNLATLRGLVEEGG